MYMFSFREFKWGYFFLLVTMALFFTPGNEFPEVNWFNKLYLDKVLHAGMFSFLAFLFIYPRRKKDRVSKNLWITIILCCCTLYGLAVEVIQALFIPYRSGDVWDFVADLTGTLIVFMWFWFHDYEETYYYVDGDTLKMKPQFQPKRKPL